MKKIYIVVLLMYAAGLFAQQINESGARREGTVSRSTGTMNTIVVLIRFSGDAEFSAARSSYDNMFNSLSAASLKNYYREVSYNKLDISSFIYPECLPTVNLSYQFPKPRGYFQPYSGSNTIGFASTREGRLREHQILDSAIGSIRAQIPVSLDLDFDDDGFVDNVMFIFKGSAGAWGDVGLWPHSGVLDSRDSRIHGGRVYHYSIHLETSLSVSTFCHETFHVLGAPDLYRYFTSGTPVGSWDLMASGGVHMGAFMKHKYTGKKWISHIPLIENSGRYTLSPLTSDTNNCFRINSPYTENEFFIVEYRRKTGLYEGSVPGSGLLVYRINTLAGEGNGGGPPDEIYIYRKGGTPTAGGTISQAFFSAASGRTAINDFTTDPKSFLANGTAAGLDIRNVGSADNTISFDVVIVDCKIAAPQPNSAFAAGSNIVICAMAKDSVAIANVQFFINGSSAATVSAPPYNFTWNTAGLQAGKYTIRAKATSQTGVYKEHSIDVFLSTGKPVVRVLMPSDSIMLGNGDTLTAACEATAITSSLASVKFYLDNTLLASFTQPPFQYSGIIQGVAPGAHTLRITAQDAAGNTETKEQTVYVVNYLVREGFEGVWPPAGWSVNSLVYGWYQSGKGAFAGSKCAATRNYHAAGEAYLETPAFLADASTSLSFWWLDRSLDITRLVGGHDTTYCEVSVNGGAYTTLSYLAAADVEPAYHKETISLAQYAGQLLRIRWRDVTDESLEAQGTALDNVAITSMQSGGSGITRVGNYSAGWNLVSAPLQMPSMLRAIIFPPANSPMYSYAGGYTARDTLEPGRGYWLRFPAAVQTHFTGTAPQNRNVPLTQGWNIIGPFENPAAVSSMSSTPPGIINSPVYGYSGNYVFVTTLEPGKGYWVRATQSGVLNLPAAPQKEMPVRSAQGEKILAGIHISDVAGNSSVLYISRESFDLNMTELPPLPPQDVSDARFDNNSSTAMLTDNARKILLQGFTFPIAIEARGVAIKLRDAATGGKIITADVKDGSSAQMNTPVNAIEVEFADAPAGFALYQNYPNPFNPVTEIRYQVGSQQPSVNSRFLVRLKIFDVLGREVTTLVNEEKPAGSYTLSFNASLLPSGVYYYELTAGNFRDVKKMVLLR